MCLKSLRSRAYNSLRLQICASEEQLHLAGVEVKRAGDASPRCSAAERRREGDSQLFLAMFHKHFFVLQAARATVGSYINVTSSGVTASQTACFNRRDGSHDLGMIGEVSQSHDQHLVCSLRISRQNQPLTLAKTRLGSRSLVAAAEG